MVVISVAYHHFIQTTLLRPGSKYTKIAMVTFYCELLHVYTLYGLSWTALCISTVSLHWKYCITELNGNTTLRINNKLKNGQLEEERVTT